MQQQFTSKLLELCKYFLQLLDDLNDSLFKASIFEEMVAIKNRQTKRRNKIPLCPIICIFILSVKQI